MSAKNLPCLPQLMIDDAVKAALLEDWGRAGDITSQATLPAEAQATAVISSRKPGVLAGIGFAESAFRQTDTALRFEQIGQDGDRLAAGDVVARIEGPARALLSAERVALNYLGHLSGIATATSRFADLIAHTKADIVCTRKTTPGLRAFEKYAVRCGGGANHRFGLDDAILIKDNHIAVAGGVALAVNAARAFAGHLVKIEVEVDTLEQLEEALTAGPDVVMLDNMPPEMLKQAVGIAAGRVLLEASGGIELDTVKAVAEAGVDLISSGWITHSAPVLDLGLDIAIS
ncbi:carboxylating nicotinate-nucleotide diphosphorylase [Roseibium salinum]|uniref:nicotinate-nucleotide diphosphorylase (carboxylating) n=1 Tax=Roseibium salinum TaxID=1604349 RepID=A0ABT3R3K3_9HYPH|nr:carboxylating nicotinate-nucleotide diphosphorylase [Roseibium sp. DSM 29163]MCX2723749.1 carboxylating nicotinate-nucleotide diphosphorylase [Roseibium sp. DSM 29163]MDN3718404.1 carboxylating nicotinate-nucleotide diphosphorylase [Roseibium salinum]